MMSLWGSKERYSKRLTLALGRKSALFPLRSEVMKASPQDDLKQETNFRDVESSPLQ